MKRLTIYTLILLVVVSCTPAKKEAALVDSLKVSPDTLSQNENSYSPSVNNDPPEPSSIFFYLEETFTEDEREATVTQELIELLKKYEAGNYLTIRNEYSANYPEEVGPDEFMNVSEYKTKTWFYDSLNRLQCFTIDYEYRVSEDRYSNMSTIYLFSNDSLIAVYEDKDESIQVTSQTHTRVVANRCPACGTLVNATMSDTYQVSEFDFSFLEGVSRVFFLENDPDFKWLNQRELNKEDENYIMEEDNSESDALERYIISPYLFEKFIRSNTDDK
jgi:hypothetical protein